MSNSDNSKAVIYKLIATFAFALYFINCISHPDDFHLIAGVNLLIHEAGHFIFMFFGEFIHILGGSLNQVIIPAIFAAYFFLRKDIYSGAIVLMWVGESIIEVARYAADAIVMQLPLLGGDNVIHDWNYLFTATHLLKYTQIISTAMYDIGLLVFITGIVVAFASVFISTEEFN